MKTGARGCCKRGRSSKAGRRFWEKRTHYDQAGTRDGLLLLSGGVEDGYVGEGAGWGPSDGDGFGRLM